MMRTKKGAVAVALGAAVALAAGACSTGGTTATSTSSGAAAAGAKGGTLYMVNLGPQEHWDPQRIYIGADIEFASRTFIRGLTMYTAGKDAKIVPDLATDTGTMSDGGKTWKFTLKDGVKWEDGQDIKCEDVKYGLSRTFAQDVITGGPNYIITFLDVPSDADGSSSYKGPYTKVGQALFDKAVTCEGKTITIRMKTPWTDFNVATAGLTAYAPFRADKDKGADSDYAIFSDGPYKLEGTFDKDKGGKFVRNTNWDASTDTVRMAYPDVIQYDLGVQGDTIYERLIADSGNDQMMVTEGSAPPAKLPLLADPKVAARTANPGAPYVDYLQPNFKSAVFSNQKAREAFALATNKTAYITAWGGSQVMIPTNAMCNKDLPCYKDFNPLGLKDAGDVDAAKAALTASGLPMPVNITVVYRSRPSSDKAFAAMKETWDKAGFNVTLEPLTQKYYATIQGPAYATKDAFWAGWGADWPSGSTVLPALLDGRVNISAGGSGQDYGYFNDADVNAAIDKAYAIADATAREKAWGDIDEMIAKKVGTIPLVNQKFTFTYGSQVKNFEVNPLMGCYVDLARISVK